MRPLTASRRLLRAVALGLVSTLALAATGAARSGPAPAQAAGGDAPAMAVGYDVSYPQCGAVLPSGEAFGVIGVNGGLANDANECLLGELSWALAAPGLVSPPQPAVSLYLDTADPGPARGVTDWPATGASAAYGRCRGGWSRACAYLYGRLRAGYSYGLLSTSDPALARLAPWWLDVETSSSWAGNARREAGALNLAAIKGFIAGLRSAGASASIGIYSFARQWTRITGLSASSTRAAFGGSPLPDWIGGKGSQMQAQRSCATRGFTGARPTLAQYSSGGFDADLRCG